MLPKRLAMFACTLISLYVATATAAEPTFFPNLSTVWIPRGTSQLLKPYLPASFMISQWAATIRS